MCEPSSIARIMRSSTRLEAFEMVNTSMSPSEMLARGAALTLCAIWVVFRARINIQSPSTVCHCSFCRLFKCTRGGPSRLFKSKARSGGTGISRAGEARGSTTPPSAGGTSEDEEELVVALIAGADDEDEEDDDDEEAESDMLLLRILDDDGGTSFGCCCCLDDVAVSALFFGASVPYLLFTCSMLRSSCSC